jgi:hypothetical protein
VHGPFRTEGRYANGVTMIISGDFTNGVKFIGSEGWICVSRGNEAVTASDPVAAMEQSQALTASNPAILRSPLGANDMHLPVSQEHHGNWLEAIRARQQPLGGPLAALGSHQGTDVI